MSSYADFLATKRRVWTGVVIDPKSGLRRHWQPSDLRYRWVERIECHRDGTTTSVFSAYWSEDERRTPVFPVEPITCDRIAYEPVHKERP